MRNEKITPLYERLSRDDELQGESNSISVAVISIPFGIRISRILCIPNGSPERNIHQNKSVCPLTFMMVDTIQNQNSINASGNIDFLITSSIVTFFLPLSDSFRHLPIKICQYFSNHRRIQSKGFHIFLSKLPSVRIISSYNL